MLKRICKAPGCTRLVDASSGSHYCIEHQALEARDREKRAQFSIVNHGQWDDMYNSPKWKVLRAQKLKEQPLCEICGNKATQVHHKIPHKGDWELFLDESNLMSICFDCHNKETRREMEELKKQRRINRNKLWY